MKDKHAVWVWTDGGCFKLATTETLEDACRIAERGYLYVTENTEKADEYNYGRNNEPNRPQAL